MSFRLSLLQSYRLETILQLSLIFLIAELMQSLLVGNMTVDAVLLFVGISGLMGCVVGFMEISVYPLFESKYSFPVLLLIKTLVNLLIVLVALLPLNQWIVPLVLFRNPDFVQLYRLNTQTQGIEFVVANWHIFSRMVLSNLIICFGVTFIYQMIQKMGRRMFWNFVSGKYHTPKEEDRIFMFVDLKDSTAIAEKLGNYRFSRFISDFFSDLNEPVLATHGEIYQYVGDQAVITWLTKDGLQQANCVQCYFVIEQKLEQRQHYYHNTYGLVPGFKAGLHCGLVVTTQVGVLKNEVCYHGDVINTASRIQEQCNGLQRQLLLSEALTAQIKLPGRYVLEFINRVKLKGKEQLIPLYSVNKSNLVISRQAS